MNDKTQFQKLLSQFKLVDLFNDLGWDRPSLRPQIVSIEGQEYTLTQVAHKRGVVVFVEVLKLGGQADVVAMLPQQLQAQAVDGAEKRAVECVEYFQLHPGFQNALSGALLHFRRRAIGVSHNDE